MSSHSSLNRRNWRVGCVILAGMLLPAAAQAQTGGDGAATAAQTAAPSDIAMVNLVRALVAQGVLKADVGEQLIQQALAEAATARSARLAGSGELPAPPSGAVRVPYIPETVRAQIKDDLRQEVLAEARSGGWAAPDRAAPDWTRMFTPRGDIRVRATQSLESRTNANDVIDFATINSFGPYGIDDPRVLLPILNTRNNLWNRTNFRARLGVDVNMTPGVSARIMLATGDDFGPISTNDTLGGGFFKRDIWLDKAWIRLQPFKGVDLKLGRFENPFNASDLLFDEDVALDGVSLVLDTGTMLGKGVKLTARGGAFPIDYGAPNYPTFAFDKPKVPNKTLFSGELQLDAKIDDVAIRTSVGYHDFHGMQGRLSDPCQVEVETFCSTDFLQPLFLTKGNTLSPLRQIVTINPNASLPQLLGYTFAYRVLNAELAVTLPLDDDTLVRATGSYVRNLGFDRADICRFGLAGRPYNNNGAGGGSFCAATNPATFVGGKNGYRGELIVGAIDPLKRGEWRANAGYRYLQSDAVLDAFTDSDFHLGGTNSKGYFIGGSYAVRNGLVLGARWLSANEISGPPLAIDVLQIDIEARF
jgi:hypothetical protein